MRAAPLGRIGQGAILVAFPCLFAPAFLNATQPELTNYIPLIRHPAYDFGLMALALGVLAPVVRLLVNLPGRLAPRRRWPSRWRSPASFTSWRWRASQLPGRCSRAQGDLMWSRAELFWGGGHVLQFVYAVLMLTNWSILARLSLGEKAVDNRVFLICVFLVALIAIPAPAFYAAFEPFSANQDHAFRLLQFALVAPTLMFAASLLARARALRPPAEWPWRDPAFFALATSLALFALGGVMGLMISGSDTRTPAHYHAVITAVSVSSAGMLLTFGLKELGRLPAPARLNARPDRPLRRRTVRRLDRHVRRRRLRRRAQDADRRRIARRRRRGGHGGARDRLHFHDYRRRGLRRDRDPGAHEDGATGIRASAVRRKRLAQAGGGGGGDRFAAAG